MVLPLFSEKEIHKKLPARPWVWRLEASDKNGLDHFTIVTLTMLRLFDLKLFGSLRGKLNEADLQRIDSEIKNLLNLH